MPERLLKNCVQGFADRRETPRREYNQLHLVGSSVRLHPPVVPVRTARVQHRPMGDRPEKQ